MDKGYLCVLLGVFLCRPSASISGPDIGHPVDVRSFVDATEEYVFVDNQAYYTAGVLTAVSLYAGMGGRPLRLGIFREVDGTPCKYELVSEADLGTIPAGFNRIELEPSSTLSFEGGDRFGFIWTGFGVVSFDFSAGEINYCHKKGPISVGDTEQMLTLHGNRIYSIMVHACLNPEIGFPVVERSVLDIAEVHTFVDMTEAPTAGEIRAVTLYAGAVGRPVRLGVYREQGGVSCNLKLIAQTEIDGLVLGFNRINLPESDWLSFEAGDFFGFTWTEFGVVEFDFTPDEPAHYCQKPVAMIIGGVQQMFTVHGKRKYSITAHSVYDTQLGYPLDDRKHVDSSPIHTFVDMQTFSAAGVVKEVNLHAKVGGRPLSVGIYREQGGLECNYKLVQEYDVSDLHEGFNKIEIPEGSWLEFEAGDSFGFSWSSLGVVSFDIVPGEPPAYCQKKVKPAVGDTEQLGTTSGDRLYSIIANTYSKDVGFPIEARTHVDIAEIGIMVDERAFQHSGYIKAVSFAAGESGRALRIGVFREVGGVACKYQLKEQFIMEDIPGGFNRVEIPDGYWLEFDVGDHFGFMWTEFGVVSFDFTAGTTNYCHRAISMIVGGIKEMSTVHGEREYSITVHTSLANSQCGGMDNFACECGGGGASCEVSIPSDCDDVTCDT